MRTLARDQVRAVASFNSISPKPGLPLQRMPGNQAESRALGSRAEGFGQSNPRCLSREMGHNFTMVPVHHRVVPAPLDASAQSQRIVAPPLVQEALGSSGNPIGPSELAFLEPRLRHDFSRVRIHSDGRAAQSARAVNARAFTVGDDIVFAAGQYQPDRREGRRLLVHELAHVVQQSAGSTPALQRQAPPTTVAVRDDNEVQRLIDDALARNPTVRAASYDLYTRRCLPENCLDENLAAAEHYMIMRNVVETTRLPPEIMAVIMSGAIGYYQTKKLLGLAESICPDICPVTPPSTFQIKWGMSGVSHGLINATLPTPPPSRAP